MVRYVVKRIAVGILTLFVLATVTFFLMHIIPGSPFSGESSNLPPSVVQKLNEKYGLDKTIWEQYLAYMGNVVRGDFGVSIYRKGKSISKIIASGLPYTAKLGLVASVYGIVAGILLGTIAAFTKRKWLTSFIIFISTLGVSVPSFLLGVLLMLLFGVQLRILPFVGLSTPFHYVLPTLCLSFSAVATITRLVKSGMQEVMKQDYMILAKSKGTPDKKVIFRHGLKNAILPVITYAGPMFATLLTGSFVIESLFSIPGIGAEYVNSVTNRDYTMIMALTILYGAMIIAANILTDIVNAMADPRIKLGK
ncbi:MAG: ABC transporter permease [Clostridiales bacterium]|nr:ABC transporter permease [Clostridiales bacterium]MCD8370713.1 ABC transporter permease [Clostridiales bacterium]